MIRAFFLIPSLTFFAPLACLAQTLPGGGSGSGGTTTTILLNGWNSAACIERQDGEDSCPDDAEDVADSLGAFHGTSCDFGNECHLKPAGSSYENDYVCDGEIGSTDKPLEQEVVILNSGSGTIVKKWKEALPGVPGHGLELDDQISCFKVTDCECIRAAIGPQYYCRKGDIKIYALARYSLSALQCIGQAQ